jgi:hypothetical protein
MLDLSRTVVAQFDKFAIPKRGFIARGIRFAQADQQIPHRQRTPVRNDKM